MFIKSGNSLYSFKEIDQPKPFEPKYPSSRQSVGEDISLMEEGDYYRLVTNHLLLEGIHFDLTYCPLKHIGYKAIVVNIADMIAMNGSTEQITVNIAVSSKFKLEALEELYAGIYLACDRYQVDLVGANIHTSTIGLVMATTALGKVDKERISCKDGAKKHDIICVSGDLGAAYLGLQILNREKQVFQADPNMQPDLAPYQYLVQRQLRPDARIDIKKTLDKLEIKPTSMIAVTDGLAADLLHITKASQVGATIYEERLPIDKATYETALSLHLDPITCAVNGGEDYELLFTIHQKDFSKLENQPDISFIGYITDASQGVHILTSGGSIVPLVSPGWK